jgi:hypothetical protein
MQIATIISRIIDAILANPGKALGILGGLIYAVLVTLLGDGLVTQSFVTTVQNIGAVVVIVLTGLFPSWGPIKAVAARHGA